MADTNGHSQPMTSQEYMDSFIRMAASQLAETLIIMGKSTLDLGDVATSLSHLASSVNEILAVVMELQDRVEALSSQPPPGLLILVEDE